jgi:hypothetical protein
MSSPPCLYLYLFHDNLILRSLPCIYKTLFLSKVTFTASGHEDMRYLWGLFTIQYRGYLESMSHFNWAGYVFAKLFHLHFN